MLNRLSAFFKNRSFPHIRLFDNLFLKIISLLFAAGIWLIVTNNNDPVTYKPFPSIPVQLIHTEMITGQGQVYKVLDGTDTVATVTVSAPRSISDELSRENIVAVADVADLTQVGTVPITFSTNIYGTQIDSIQGSIDSVRLEIQQLKTAWFTLQTTTNGTPAEGYVLSDVTPEQNQVRVSGAESVVSSIARVVATVDVSGARNTITTYAAIRLYDQNDNQIDTDGLTMNINSVRTTVNVLATKMMPVRFSTSGVPASGYLRNGNMTVEPAEVLLKGRLAALNAADAVIIPGDAVSIGGASSDVVKTVDISEYLPDNLDFADESFDGNVQVTVGIEAAAVRTIELDPSGLMLENIPDGYTVSVISAAGEGFSEKVNVVVAGLPEAVRNLNPETLQGRVDVAAAIEASSMPEAGGLIPASVRISLPPQVQLQSASSVVLYVVAAEQDEQNN